MNKPMKSLANVILFCASFLFFQIAYAASPVGYWKTIDDVTGKPKSILQISGGSSLSGTIVKIYPRPGYDVNEICTACPGARHNKPLVGMTIMSGLKQSKDNPNEWSGGQIMDPLNGKTYRCFIEVVNGGQKLNVRGYVGVSLFGRTQTWVRASGPQG